MSQDKPLSTFVETGPSAAPGSVGDVSTGPGLGSGINPSECGCAACSRAAGQGGNMVFVLGVLNYDLVNEARLESIHAHMGGDPEDHDRFLKYLENNPWEAASVTWTLEIEEAPVYAILPGGPFAAEGFRKLREFLGQHKTEETERVSIPGRITDRTTLRNGQILDVIVPELRGMASWTTSALVGKVVGKAGGDASPSDASHSAKVEGVRNFLHRVYYELRNLGVTAQERALNFAATNASKVAGVFETAVAEKMELDAILVERSPLCRPGSDCWDVKMIFFHPDLPIQSIRKSHRFTVDVSDVVPVLVGPIRSWSVR